MKLNHKTATFLMVTVAFSWGTSYLFMKIGLSGVSPFNLIALRFGIAFIAMIFIFWKRMIRVNLKTIKQGIILGSLLFLIFSCLVIGIKFTSSSTAAFLASTTVIFVPIIEVLLFKKRLNTKIYFSVFLTLIGLYLLTSQKTAHTLNIGALLCISTAVFYAYYIVILDRISAKKDKSYDLFLVSILQLGVVALLGLLCSLIFEVPTLPNNSIQWISVIVLGLFCSAYGFVMQPIVQKYLSAEKIGFIFSLEPVFASILGFLFLNESLGFRGCAGAILILVSVFYSIFRAH